MKKVFAVLLVLLLLGLTFPLTEAQQGDVQIATRTDLMKIADDPHGSYVLVADIDMGGEPWTPIPFSGKLDGAGHTIGNLTVRETGADTCITFDGNRKEYETSFAGLFSIVTNAEIRNLRILNAKISIETDSNCFTGAIAGYAKESLIENCTVSTRSTLTISAVNCGVGGMIGFADHCTFDSCSAEAELVFIDVNRDVLCEEFLGGVYASGYANIRDSAAYTRGYADIYGYAHNGGMVGMFKLPRRYDGKKLSVRDSTVDAEIRFFEVTPSKRAYCDPVIGENSAGDCYLTHNTVQHFDFTYERTAQPKRPESCEQPSYAKTVTEPTCSEWGYTVYTCTGCGYSYRDDYTLPAHAYDETIEKAATCAEEGKALYTCKYCGDSYTGTLPVLPHTECEWRVTREAGPDTEGEETLYCAVCGAVLETRPIPAIAKEPDKVIEDVVPVQRIQIDETVIELKRGESAVLEAAVEPFDATNNTLHFESSDPGVVAVDETGLLTALYPGAATIRIYSEDGGAEATVSVLVTAQETPPEEQETHSFFSWMRCG